MTPDPAGTLKAVFATNRNWAECATIAVFVGLLGDILVIFLFSKDKPRSETWLAFVCTLLIAVGVYGEYSFGAKAAQAADELQRLSDREIAGLKLKASEADERSKTLEKETVILRQQLIFQEREALYSANLSTQRHLLLASSRLPSRDSTFDIAARQIVRLCFFL